MTNNTLDEIQISLREMRAELAQQKDDLKQFQNQFSSKEDASNNDVTAYLRAEIEARIRAELPELLAQTYPSFATFFSALDNVEGVDIADITALLRGDDDVSSARIEQMILAARGAMQEAVEQQIITYFRRMAITPF